MYFYVEELILLSSITILVIFCMLGLFALFGGYQLYREVKDNITKKAK